MTHVVDGHNAASILVDTVASILGGQEGGHQSCMPVIGNKEDLLSIGQPRGLP